MAQQVPASSEMEQALLGSMFLYPDTIKKAFEENLQPNDFFVDANKKIYQAVLALNEEGKPTDVTSVMTRLVDNNQLNNIGGSEYIEHLTDIAISSVNTEYYISNIKEKALLRKLIEVADTIKQNAFEGQSAALDVLNDAESLITKVSRDRKTSELKTSKETFDDVIKTLAYNSTHQGLTGIPSGFDDLDRITNGFQSGDLVIIAARPSVGKTALALNIASNAATLYNKNVALFSLEMSSVQLGNRMLSAKSGVYSDKIKTGKYLTNDDWGKIDSAKAKLEKANIFIDESTAIKVNDIFAKCRKLKSDHGLDIIIIDYLQLISPSEGRNDSREQQISAISRALKGLARELEVPVIALSQMSRDAEKNKREPMLSDLRESGAIEQDADIVMFLHRPYTDEKKKANDEQDEKKQVEDNNSIRDIKLIIAKHRNGEVGFLHLAFDGNTNTFYTRERISNEEY